MNVAIVDRVAGHPPVLHGQEVHGEVDALELAALDRQVARLGRAAAEADGVELGRGAPAAVMSTPTLVAGPEDDPLGLHLLEPAVEVPLLHLEVGDAVAEQAADPVGALEDGDRVPGAGELLGAGQPGRARSRRPPRSCRSGPWAAGGRPSPRPRPGR